MAQTHSLHNKVEEPRRQEQVQHLLRIQAIVKGRVKELLKHNGGIDIDTGNNALCTDLEMLDAKVDNVKLALREYIEEAKYENAMSMLHETGRRGSQVKTSVRREFSGWC